MCQVSLSIFDATWPYLSLKLWVMRISRPSQPDPCPAQAADLCEDYGVREAQTAGVRECKHPSCFVLRTAIKAAMVAAGERTAPVCEPR